MKKVVTIAVIVLLLPFVSNAQVEFVPCSGKDPFRPDSYLKKLIN